MKVESEIYVRENLKLRVGRQRGGLYLMGIEFNLRVCERKLVRPPELRHLQFKCGPKEPGSTPPSAL
jgi:hypothetical protein